MAHRTAAPFALAGRPAEHAPAAPRAAPQRHALAFGLAGAISTFGAFGAFGAPGLAGLLALGAPAAHAADTPEPAPARTADQLAAVRKRIEAGQWTAAIAELRRVNATASADWNNLMGYALRKQTPPDLDGAQRHYDAALRIDPSHQGALEYAGELALMKGDLATAEANRATLARLCTSPCEPLDDLTRAIARYKASGNRWQP